MAPSSLPSGPPGPPHAAEPAAAPAAFKPTRLGKHDLEVRVNPLMREMPAEMQREILERERDLVSRFDLGNPRNVRRWRHYTAGSLVGLPFLTWLMTPIGLDRLWAQLILAGLYATAMAFLRPRGSAAGFLLMGTGVATFAATGHGGVIVSLGGVFTLVLFFMVGLALGISEGMTSEGD